MTFQVRVVWKKMTSSHSITLRKNSPYTPFLKRIMLNLIESGQLQKIKDEYARKANRLCEMTIEKDENEDGTPLSYQKVFMLFVIIGAGITLSLSTLMFERFVKRMKLNLKWSHQDGLLQEIPKPRMVDSSTQTYNFQDQNIIKTPYLTSIQM